MADNLRRITSTAKRVRKEFENQAVDKKLLAELYRAYNQNVTNIDKFVDQAISLFPRLNCGLASVYMQHVLGEGEIVKGKYKDNHHTYLQIDGLIVDITADQFGGPSVYVSPLKFPWKN